MTKTDYKEILSKLNKKLTKKLEEIKKKSEMAKAMIRHTMTSDPRQDLIKHAAEEFRQEVKDNDK